MNKKTVLGMIFTIVIVVSMMFSFGGCSDDKNLDAEGNIIASKIVSFEVEDYKLYVGDKFNKDNIKITATLDDKTTQEVKNNRIYNQDDLDKINDELNDDGEFTKAGTYTIRIYHLEERKDMFVGTCNVKVVIKNEI